MLIVWIWNREEQILSTVVSLPWHLRLQSNIRVWSCPETAWSRGTRWYEPKTSRCITSLSVQELTEVRVQVTNLTWSSGEADCLTHRRESLWSFGPLVLWCHCQAAADRLPADLFKGRVCLCFLSALTLDDTSDLHSQTHSIPFMLWLNERQLPDSTSPPTNRRPLHAEENLPYCSVGSILLREGPSEKGSDGSISLLAVTHPALTSITAGFRSKQLLGNNLSQFLRRWHHSQTLH